jgi:predicted nucleic acid-binding protein
MIFAKRERAVSVDSVDSSAFARLLDGEKDRASLAARAALEGGNAYLIAQSCLDHDIPLITYDHDFRHFVRVGLKLV